MGDVNALIEDREFVVACARYAEGLLSEETIKEKWRFNAETWERLGSDDALVEAIEAEKAKRMRDGTTARERAQVLFAETPTVLGSILHDDDASARHRIESARELRQIAANGPEAAPARLGRFQITINLGADVLHFDKSIAIDANDVDPHNTDTTPQELLPAIAAKKRDGDGGEPI